jgi:Tfp pilus assembly protein FimT
MRTHSQSGVTLVEISVILAIIGILAALGTASLRGTMPRIRLGNNASTLANEISLARVRAISKSARFRINFAPAGESYTLERENAPNVWVGMGTTNLTGTDLVSATNFLDANTVIADINGTMSVAFNSQGVVILATPDGFIQKRILVEPIGRVYLERSGDGGSSWTRE